MDYTEKLINGKNISFSIKQELFKEVEKLTEQGITPQLTVILAGNNEASKIYVKNKEIGCREIGISSEIIRMPENTTEQTLLSRIKELNENKAVNGILVQLPLPPQMDEDNVIQAIDPHKDVDGFHPMNVGNLVLGRSDSLISCTPAGIIELLDHSGVEIASKNVVIVGRSNIVGKPLFHLMLQRHATVTVAHSKTKNLSEITSKADILCVAVGKTNLITAEHVKKGAVVIDVGMNRVDGKLCGDVDFEAVAPLVSKITPVPRGVGPMTIAMLLKNTVKATKIQHNIE